MLKLKLEEDGKVLWEIPLQATAWNRHSLRRELDKVEREMARFEATFNALANHGRMRMMRVFFRDTERPLGFTELMNELGMNPKIVSESTKRLRSTGLIEKNENGKYSPTRTGEAQFLLMSVAMRRMLEIMDQL
jgi:DNA-binding HxlR family transcriptional regulator